MTFKHQIALGYSSPSQQIRVLSEHWTHENLFCPSCGAAQLEKSPNNRPVSDFVCSDCQEVFELKSKRGSFGRKLTDGAYATMLRRLTERNSPSLLLLNYAGDPPEVTKLSVVPRQFLIPAMVEKRRPLALTARRAGWVGCNVLLDGIPLAGRISLYDFGRFRSREEVVDQWRRTAFLASAEHAGSQGWLIHVMKAIESLERDTFSLADIYCYEDWFKTLYPANDHVRPKLRQQLQRLRDVGYLEFTGRGTYKVSNGRATATSVGAS